MNTDPHKAKLAASRKQQSSPSNRTKHNNNNNNNNSSSSPSNRQRGTEAWALPFHPAAHNDKTDVPAVEPQHR